MIDHPPSPDPLSAAALARKNRLAGFLVLGAVVGMMGLSFAAVPLYDLFCRVTGYGGTVQISANSPDFISERVMRVRFVTKTSSGLNWDFTPELREVRVRLGESGLISYHVRNRGLAPSAGTAVYNVTPLKAGKYFHKTQCFCFGEQILQGGTATSLPVVFYVDPALDSDPNMDDVKTITLSYTFFSTGSAELEAALEAFYDDAGEPSAD